ncbi:MAG: SAM-dependent methyltransferase [Ruminococcus sp.]|nr:SAM-dependent methyltransferase [Ruminococcus sp.]
MKNPFSLSRRLALCASYVAQDSRLADIGTDHAYLPIALCLDNKILSAVACDIAQGPLGRAKENILRYELADKIETRLSDGLQNVKKDEIDTVVIAGMGGELIAKILSECPYIKDKSLSLILQPMTRCEKLILWLYENGFAIQHQSAVTEDGKHYTVMLVRYTGEVKTPSPLSLYLGKLSKEHDEEKTFLEHTLNRLKKQAIGDDLARIAARQLEEYLYEN